MPRSRLAAALEGGLVLPEGPVLALRPPAGADLDALGRPVTVATTWRPDHDAWAARGLRVGEPSDAAMALAFAPRSKALARALVAEAAARAPLVLLDGQRADGIDALWREVRERRPDAEALAQGHGRLLWFRGGAGFEDWAARGPAQGADGLWTQAGTFSEGGIDRGSALLAAALPARLPPRMADLGAGAGVLARAVLARGGVVSVDLVEAERLALDCAALNVADPRARLLWADALRLPQATEWDGIVMNPPFHATARAEPDLGRGFVAAAARALAPAGQLWMVANRHLPYEAGLRGLFRQVAEVEGAGDAGFKVLHAAQPVARRGGGRRPAPAARSPAGPAGRLRRRP